MTTDSVSGPEPGVPTIGPRDAAQRERFLAGFLVILVMAIALLQAMAPDPVTDGAGEPVPPAERLDLVLQGRYTYGASVVFERFGPAGQQQAGQLARGLAALDAEPSSALCLAPVFQALDDEASANRVLGVAPSTLSDDAASALGLLRGEVASGDEAEAALVRYCGWFGELALARQRDDSEALAALRSGAVRLTFAIFGIAVLGLGGLVVGSILAILAYARHRRGELPSRYSAGIRAVAADGRGAARVAYLETIVFFLLGLQVLGVFVSLLIGTEIGLFALLLQWAIVPLIAWPLQRGESRAALGEAIGWAKPRSVPVEIACGFVAYLASAPLLALGLVGSILVARLVPSPPYHPVMDWVQGGDSILGVAMIFVIAVVWAPVVEETMFRGAFYHYLRGRFGALVSALLVALAFALIHPQGLIGVPFLVCLAVALALTREWRGSILASMTMHAVHNGLAITFLFLILGGS